MTVISCSITAKSFDKLEEMAIQYCRGNRSETVSWALDELWAKVSGWKAEGDKTATQIIARRHKETEKEGG